MDVSWTSNEDSLPTVHTLPEDGFFPEVGCPETKTDPNWPREKNPSSGSVSHYWSVGQQSAGCRSHSQDLTMFLFVAPKRAVCVRRDIFNRNIWAATAVPLIACLPQLAGVAKVFSCWIFLVLVFSSPRMFPLMPNRIHAHRRFVIQRWRQNLKGCCRGNRPAEMHLPCNGFP